MSRSIPKLQENDIIKSSPGMYQKSLFQCFRTPLTKLELNGVQTFSPPPEFFTKILQMQQRAVRSKLYENIWVIYLKTLSD